MAHKADLPDIVIDFIRTTMRYTGRFFYQSFLKNFLKNVLTKILSVTRPIPFRKKAAFNACGLREQRHVH